MRPISRSIDVGGCFSLSRTATTVELYYLGSPIKAKIQSRTALHFRDSLLVLERTAFQSLKASSFSRVLSRSSDPSSYFQSSSAYPNQDQPLSAYNFQLESQGHQTSNTNLKSFNQQDESALALLSQVVAVSPLKPMFISIVSCYNH